MSVQLDVEQVRTVEQGPVYRTVTTVIYNLGIDRNIFVFNAETEAFEHVATPWDMANTPTARQTALDNGIDYYRLSEVTQDRDTLDDATEVAAYTLGRVSSLTQAYTTATEDFVGSETYSYTGS